MKRKKNGQSILEFSLMLPVIVGFCGLIVDGGLAMWRKQVTTTAAHTMTTAAAVQALAVLSVASTPQCGVGVHCTSGYQEHCRPNQQPSPWNNLHTGCSIAEINFSSAFKSSAVISAGMSGAPSVPIIPGLTVAYTIQATVSEVVAPLFSGGFQINSQSTAVVYQSGTTWGVIVVQ